MINPIDLLAEDCAFWESRYDYINLLTEFINSKITGQDFETRFYEMFRKDVDKKYNWEQVGLRFPKDNEQIVKQASFANTILRVSNYDNYYRFETIEEANKQFREQVQIEFLHLTNLIHQN